MSYLPALVVVAVGLVLLVVVIIRLRRTVRRLRATVAVVNTGFGYETGTLRARSAAARVAMKETRDRVKHASADVPSGRRGRQEDDRG